MWIEEEGERQEGGGLLYGERDREREGGGEDFDGEGWMDGYLFQAQEVGGSQWMMLRGTLMCISFSRWRKWEVYPESTSRLQGKGTRLAVTKMIMNDSREGVLALKMNPIKAYCGQWTERETVYVMPVRG